MTLSLRESLHVQATKNKLEKEFAATKEAELYFNEQIELFSGKANHYWEELQPIMSSAVNKGHYAAEMMVEMTQDSYRRDKFRTEQGLIWNFLHKSESLTNKDPYFLSALTKKVEEEINLIDTPIRPERHYVTSKPENYVNFFRKDCYSDRLQHYIGPSLIGLGRICRSNEINIKIWMYNGLGDWRDFNVWFQVSWA